MTDIIEDLHARLLEIGFKDPKIEKVLFEVRRDWHGERPYIGMKNEVDKFLSQRNISIIRAFKSGESIALIARRHMLSRMMVYKIIKG